MAADTAFGNAQENSDRENARIEHDKALLRVMTSITNDDNQLFKQFMDDVGFKRWMKQDRSPATRRVSASIGATVSVWPGAIGLAHSLPTGLTASLG